MDLTLEGFNLRMVLVSLRPERIAVVRAHDLH